MHAVVQAIEKYGGFVLKAALLALAVLFLLPFRFCEPPLQGLDPSWRLALHLAVQQGMTFGRDIAFTYGPLGFLSARMCFPGTRIPYLISDLFLWAHIGWIVATVIRQGLSLAGYALLALMAFMVVGHYYLVDLALSLYLITLFHIFRDGEVKSRTSLVLASVAAATALFVKANFGLIGITVQAAYLVLLATVGGRRRDALIGAAGLVGMLTVWLLILNVDLIPFIRNSALIASGYNDGMFVTFPDRSQHLFRGLVIVGSMALLVAWGLIKPESRWQDRGRLLVVALTTLLLFKQGFVRADGHEATFFAFVPVLAAILYLFVQTPLKDQVGRMVLVAVVLGFPFESPSLTVGRPHDEIDMAETYAREATGEYPPGYPATEAQRTLPEGLRESVARGTVDVIPTEISLTYFNQLRYNPRPVFQSYSAYDPKLDALNAEKYQSNSAPDAIFFKVECIDGRYCFFDETRTKEVLFERYRVKRTPSEWLLFKQAQKERTLTKAPAITRTMYLGDKIEMPIVASNQAIQVRFDVQYSLAGTILSMLYHPPELRMLFELPAGELRDFRVLRRILNGGVWMSPYVDNQEDGRSFFRGDWDKMRRPSGFTLATRHAWAFKQPLSVEFTVVSASRSDVDAQNQAE
jgi:hypothetical protein